RAPRRRRSGAGRAVVSRRRAPHLGHVRRRRRSATCGRALGGPRMIAIIICASLALLLLLDGLRIRGRLGKVPVIAPSSEAVSEEHRFLRARGAGLDEATMRAASAFARENRLKVLDLVPSDLSAPRAWSFLQFFD